MTLDGIVEEVHAQILQMNPRWNEDFDFQPSGPPTSTNLLDKRTLFDDSMRYDFVGDDRQAVIVRIQQGNTYLGASRRGLALIQGRGGVRE